MGWIWLTVPIISKGLGRQRISDVKIDNNFNWQRQHLRSLKAWYGRAKFFKEYSEFFEAVYAKKWNKLLDLNKYIINFILESLNIKTPIYNESDLDIHSQATERIIQICKRLKANTYISGSGGKVYLEEDKFKDTGIKLVYQEFIHPVYNQLYCKNNEFLPNMSIVDLLFNYGMDSLTILRNSNKGG